MYDRKHIAEIVDWIDKEAYRVGVNVSIHVVEAAIAFVILEELLGNKIRRIAVRKQAETGAYLPATAPCQEYAITVVYGADSNGQFREYSSRSDLEPDLSLLYDYPSSVQRRYAYHHLRWEIEHIPQAMLWVAGIVCVFLAFLMLLFPPKKAF